MLLSRYLCKDSKFLWRYEEELYQTSDDGSPEHDPGFIMFGGGTRERQRLIGKAACVSISSPSGVSPLLSTPAMLLTCPPAWRSSQVSPLQIHFAASPCVACAQSASAPSSAALCTCEARQTSWALSSGPGKSYISSTSPMKSIGVGVSKSAISQM